MQTVNDTCLSDNFRQRIYAGHIQHFYALRKQAYSIILKILQPKKENFQIKKTDILHISAQNIECGYSLEPPRRGGSNEYSQSMFSFSKIRKIMYIPVNASLTILKWGLRGSKVYRSVFVTVFPTTTNVVRNCGTIICPVCYYSYLNVDKMRMLCLNIDRCIVIAVH